MFALSVAPGVYSVGALNPGLRVFDIVMRTEYGTSYNAYLIDDEKKALIETCHASFFDAFVEDVSAVCDPEEIDYIVLNHTEPDHSGALARLLELCPKAQILCTQAASLYLKHITNRADLPLHVVKDGETLSLGAHTLRFVTAPFLHWPDSMFTYCPESRTVFTCDFLGSHYCEPRMLDACITYPDKYEEALKGYYDAIFGPFPAYVQKGLEKLSALDFDTVCPSHGPVLTRGRMLDAALEKYAAWSAPRKREGLRVPVFYCTAYGNTRRLAGAVREGMLEVRPEAQVELLDLVDQDMDAMGAALNASDAFVIGSPTINADAVPPVWQLLAHIDAINIKKRPCAVFGSYGWSGEAVPALCERLARLKANVFGEGLRVQFVPSEQDLEAARAFGRAFGETL